MENRNQNNSFENNGNTHSLENMSHSHSNGPRQQNAHMSDRGQYYANPQPRYQQPYQRQAHPQGGMPPQYPKRQSAFSQNFMKLFIVFVLAFAGGIGGAYVYSNYLDDITTVEPTTSTTTSTNATEVAKKMTASVVAITTEKMSTYNYGYGNEVSSGAGSGVIYTKDGYIVTCAHVVDGASRIVVTTVDQQQYSATLIGSDSSQDIAVLKIDADDLTPATFADSSKIAQGATTYAVGNPEGRLSNSITSGIISATSRSIEVATGDKTNSMYQSTIKLTVIQTDAAVSPGNSGGGLFDANGNLIGLVSAKSVQSGSEGLAFAIHSNTVKTIAKKLMA